MKNSRPCIFEYLSSKQIKATSVQVLFARYARLSKAKVEIGRQGVLILNGKQEKNSKTQKCSKVTPEDLLRKARQQDLSHPEDQHFSSGSMKSGSGSRFGDSGSFLDMISYHNFCPDRNESFLKFLRIEVSDASGGFQSSGSPSGSNSPDD